MNRVLKAQSMRLALKTITGSNPVIVEREGNFYITWEGQEQERIQSYIDKMIDKKNDTGVYIDYNKSIVPVIKKRYAPRVFLGAVSIMAIGYLLGRA